MAAVGRTAAEVRDVIVEGETGLLGIYPPWQRPRYNPSKLTVYLHNGATVHLHTADQPDSLRGPNYYAAWADEIAAWRYGMEAWDNLTLAVRLGIAKIVATTTPKPVQLIRRLMADPGTILIRGTTYDNIANLSGVFRQTVLERHEGTRMGRQEIHGELLEDIPGALWRREWIRLQDVPRIMQGGKAVPDMSRIVVAIDPAVSSGEEADETGIVAAGRGAKDERGYVMADWSMRGTPIEWATRAIELYREVGADRIVAEANNGGELVSTVLRSIDPNIPITLVRASRGKIARAEPVAALYEQGRIGHAVAMPSLEDQLCSYTAAPGDTSPDRLDALVWALTSIFEMELTGAAWGVSGQSWGVG